MSLKDIKEYLMDRYQKFNEAIFNKFNDLMLKNDGSNEQYNEFLKGLMN